MPYNQCPKCGAVYHISIKAEAVAEYNRKHEAERLRGEIPKYLCFKCWEAAGKPENWLPSLESKE